MNHGPPSLTRRRFLRALAAGGGALAVAGGAGLAQAQTLGVSSLSRPLPGLSRPLRLAFLSDLHFGLYVGVRQLRAWVDAALDTRADLVLLGGDLLDQRGGRSPSPLVRELGRLRAPLGVYGVWGNHDYGSFGKYGSAYYGQARADWADRRSGLEEDFRRAGVIILRDQGVSLRADLHLGGVDDLWHGTPDVDRALAGAGERATILVSHNPDVLPDLSRPAGLVMCGHTHGGQVRLPLVGAPVVPSRYGQRYAMGWVQGAHGTPAYVSRGLGTSGVPLRSLCPPEIVLLSLLPA